MEDVSEIYAAAQALAKEFLYSELCMYSASIDDLPQIPSGKKIIIGVQLVSLDDVEDAGNVTIAHVGT